MSSLIPRPDGGEWSRDIVSQRLPWDTCNGRGEKKLERRKSTCVNLGQTLPVFSLAMLLKDFPIPLHPLWMEGEEWLPTLRRRKRRKRRRGEW